MTQLLISVKNSAEALIAAELSVDIIDLKDPNNGALGALDMVTSKAIISTVNRHTYNQMISSTVGENHANLNDLVIEMQARASIGVNIIKIAVSALFTTPNFFAKMRQLSNDGIKVVVVFFADEPIDVTWLAKLKQANFYGAMLDTKNKHNNLTQVQTKNDLQSFTQSCHQLHLQSGLAGSLQPQHIEELLKYNSTYIGFRGGVCENLTRKSDLSRTKVIEAQKLLHTHNKTNAKPPISRRLALHS